MISFPKLSDLFPNLELVINHYRVCGGLSARLPMSLFEKCLLADRDFFRKRAHLGFLKTRSFLHENSSILWTQTCFHSFKAA